MTTYIVNWFAKKLWSKLNGESIKFSTNCSDTSWDIYPWRKYFQNTQLVKDLHMEYIKNLQNAMKRFKQTLHERRYMDCKYKQMKDTAFHGHSPSSKNDLAIGKLFHLLCLHQAPVATLLPKHWGKNNFFPSVPLILSHVKRQNCLHKKWLYSSQVLWIFITPEQKILSVYQQ